MKAMDIAEKHLEPLNAIRLGLVLNFSVFYFEIVRSTKMACELSKKVGSDSERVILLTEKFFFEALDLANADDNDNQSNDKKSTDSQLILKLIRDNLQIWGAYEAANDYNENSPKAEAVKSNV
jgi:14-3-3 protein epsilon